MTGVGRAEECGDQHPPGRTTAALARSASPAATRSTSDVVETQGLDVTVLVGYERAHARDADPQSVVIAPMLPRQGA